MTLDQIILTELGWKPEEVDKLQLQFEVVARHTSRNESVLSVELTIRTLLKAGSASQLIRLQQRVDAGILNDRISVYSLTSSHPTQVLRMHLSIKIRDVILKQQIRKAVS